MTRYDKIRYGLIVTSFALIALGIMHPAFADQIGTAGSH